MKLILGFLILSVVYAQSAAAFFPLSGPINYSEGFCVPEGQDLVQENAVVTIFGNTVNGVEVDLVNEDHNFFHPSSGEQQLFGVDWGGYFRLNRTSGVVQDTFTAHLEARMHNMEPQVEPQAVQCTTGEKSCYLQSACIRPGLATSCHPEGDRCSCRSFQGWVCFHMPDPPIPPFSF